MKTASIIAIFAIVFLSYTIRHSCGTLAHFGTRHESRQTGSLNPAKRTTDARKSLNSRPTVRPHYTTQTRPVDRPGTRRMNLKPVPSNILSLHKKDTVHSGDVTSPHRTISTVTGSQISIQRNNNWVTTGHHVATSSHVKAFVGHNSVTGVSKNTGIPLPTSQSATSVYHSIKTRNRNDTISSFSNTTPRPTYRTSTIRDFGYSTFRPKYRRFTVRNLGNTTVRPTYSRATIRNFGNTTVRPTYSTATIRNFGNRTVRPIYSTDSIRNLGNTTVRPTYSTATIRNFGNRTVRPIYSTDSIRNLGNTTVRPTYSTATIRNFYTTTDKYRTATISNIDNSIKKHNVLDRIKHLQGRNISSSVLHFFQELAHNESIVSNVLPGDIKCPIFVCDNGHVLSGGFMICDGIKDCSDGSDEINTDNTNCSNSKVFCRDGVCINQHRAGDLPELCDPIKPTQNIVKTTVCQSDFEFQCGNTLQCVERTDVCDGVADCVDGSDETSCSCSGFQCKNGNCILDTDKCDGVDDCGDRSDEHGCPSNKYPRSCSGHFASGSFQCGDELCVEKSRMCDNVLDCWDGSDEDGSMCHSVSHTLKHLCGMSDFVCSNGKCVNKDKRCDGLDNCGDHSDEDFCHLDISSRFHTILAYSFGGVGALVFLVILIGTIVYCHKKKRHAIRTFGSSIRRTGVSFENPISELKSQY